MSASDPSCRRLDPLVDLGLGPVDQISFAVEDISAGLAIYEPLFGKFTIRETILSSEDLVYQGHPAGAHLMLAFCRSGDVEIELVQVVAGAWPTLNHISKHGPGLHHLRFLVESLEGKMLEMETVGFVPVLHGVSPRGSRFAYLEAPHLLGSTMVELLQPPSTTPG